MLKNIIFFAILHFSEKYKIISNLKKMTSTELFLQGKLINEINIGIFISIQHHGD